jgi:hypothetical protein
MRNIIAIIAKEIQEALPATIFFIILFHLIGFSKAVVLDDYSFTALRSVGATLGALIVAKSVLIVQALPVARLFSSRRISNILWRTLLYSVVAILFRFVEELIPHVSKHGEILLAITATLGEISWPLFAVLALWLICGLFLYTIASELVQVGGPDKIKEALFSRTESRSEPDGNA